MIRTATSLLVLTVALAGTASAQEVRISLAGKSAKTISSEIQSAAGTVCRRAYIDMRIGHEEVNSCVRAAIQDAQAQARAAPSRVTLASSEPAAPRR